MGLAGLHYTIQSRSCGLEKPLGNSSEELLCPCVLLYGVVRAGEHKRL